MNRVRRLAHIELSRRSLWHFCKVMHPDFYRPDRWHLRQMCDTLQALYEGRLTKSNGMPYKKLMINLPPRHGKSFTLINFELWCLGQNQEHAIITISYNEILSARFSKAVRNSIETINIDRNRIGYNDIFPGVRVKHGDSAVHIWALSGRHMSFLGGSPGGTLTGIGCDIGVFDDLIKNAEEAVNETRLESHWKFYGDTFLDRLEGDPIQVIAFTRWSKRDVCGRLLVIEPDEWYVLAIPIEDGNGKMLCEEILSRVKFEEKKRIASPELLRAKYYQQPIDKIGQLYSGFKTYSGLPVDDRGRPGRPPPSWH